MWFADFANLGGCYLIKSHLSQPIFFFVSVLCESAANLDTIYRNLVPRALFPGFGPAPKAREKRPGDEVAYTGY